MGIGRNSRGRVTAVAAVFSGSRAAAAGAAGATDGFSGSGGVAVTALAAVAALGTADAGPALAAGGGGRGGSVADGHIPTAAADATSSFAAVGRGAIRAWGTGGLVQAAVAYYGEYRDEIDTEIEIEHNEAEYECGRAATAAGEQALRG
jgi:hypothetical protein